MSLIIPNTFANKTGQVQLGLLDDNFTYLANLTIGDITGNATSGSYLRGNGTDVVMSAIQVGDIPTPVTSNWFNGGIPRVRGDGVMEVGRYINFHSTNLGTSDFDVRMDCSGVNAITFGSATVTAAAFKAPGAVVQVATAVAGPTRQTINTSTATAITGLSIAFTPKYSNSLIIIQANISTNAFYVSSFGIYKDGAPTVSTTGFVNPNEANMQVTTYTTVASNVQQDNMYVVPVLHTESAGSTTARTYTVVATSAWNIVNPAAGNTLYINNRVSNDMSSFSHMFIYEIAQ